MSDTRSASTRDDPPARPDAVARGRASPTLAGAGATLVERIVAAFVARIDDHALRPGMRLASIRRLAAEQGVSRFTVVEAYDRLIARGYVESRRGSGFYVRPRDADGPAAPAPRAPATDAPARPDSRLDIGWLLRHMLTRELPPQDMPGVGTLPRDWFDADLLRAGVRAAGRGGDGTLIDYGSPQGYLPLRQQLQQKLAEVEIAARPAQILTTCGVTQGLDLVAQCFLRPGDTVFVDEPSWFLMYARFALLGARVVGVPRQGDGPDLERLRALALHHRPKLFVLHSVLHNPSSTGLSAAKAFQVLRLAHELDFRLVEDDIYCDLHPGGGAQPAVRLAALDQLDRVIYLSGFSKTLSANLRVGFVACDPDTARRLVEIKMLTALASPELGERVVHKVLADGHHRRLAQRLRARLDQVRQPALRGLERVGLRAAAPPAVGMFAWMDAGRDTAPVARALLEQGFVTAPGSLFMPDQRPSTFMRFNLATSSNPRMLDRLARALDGAAPVRASGVPFPSNDPERTQDIHG